jgi:3-isopropylmalate/(R)-2-methylmalate dehydratase small subunit
MQAFSSVTAVAAPLLRDNIDTDIIIPSREMKSVAKTGLADPNPEFVLNQPAYAGTAILLGGGNFGCGSSREHAAWALAEYGIRAVLAPSFAPIFFGNCVRNGIAPVKLPADVIAGIADSVAKNPAANQLTVDLRAMRVSLPDGRHWPFEMGEEQREMLLDGLDAIDLTWKWRTQIEDFVAADRKARPWIYLDNSVR